MSLPIRLAELGWLPEKLTRARVRRRLRERIRAIERDTEAERRELIERLVTHMDESPFPGPATRPAGHEPAASVELLRLMLGGGLETRCCFWPAGTADLDDAETAMLARICENAGLEDGMDLLELGCGWGSLALWLAEKFPACRILAVAQTSDQMAFVGRQAEERGLSRLEVTAGEPGDFETSATFDRVFGIEVFDHTLNRRELLRRLRGFLRAEGRLLLQSVCHRRWPYLIDPEEESGSARLMPSDDLLYRFQDDLEIERHSSLSGEHYERTAEAWLRRMRRHRDDLRTALRRELGAAQAERVYRRRCLRLVECAERFGYHRGQEWWVNHYLMRPRGRS